MSTDEFDAHLSELEIRLERLRSLYEQYFVGLEKIEPAVARKDVDRRFWELRKVKVRNTARRFKFQTLIQRYNTLQQYWMKVCRQIENGTYVRHLARAKRRMEQTEVHATPKALQDVALAADDPTPDEVRAAFSDLQRGSLPPASLAHSLPSRPPRRSARPNEGTVSLRPGPALTSLNERSAVVPPPRRQRVTPSRAPRARTSDLPRAGAAETTEVATPKPVLPRGRAAAPSNSSVRPSPNALRKAATSPADPSALSDARIDHLYAELERARQNVGGDPISRNALAKSLRQTEERLKAKHDGKQVDFRVEIQDGTARIKPVVKR